MHAIGKTKRPSLDLPTRSTDQTVWGELLSQPQSELLGRGESIRIRCIGITSVSPPHTELDIIR
jgi:hypothetical protein